MKTVTACGAPAPIGPYSAAVEANGFLFLSGQLPLTQNNDMPSGIEAQTEQVLENVGSLLAAAGISFSRVVKIIVYLADISHFAHFNNCYAGYFKPPYPARVCIQAAALPKGALIEMEVTAQL